MKRKPNLKKKLWTLFSKYIRLRDADTSGYVKCISCERKLHWKDMHAGHYWAKSLGTSIYFDEQNVHAQCPGCNLFKHGNQPEYAIALTKRYGPAVLDELYQRRYKELILRRPDYEELIETYKEKLKYLETNEF